MCRSSSHIHQAHRALLVGNQTERSAPWDLSHSNNTKYLSKRQPALSPAVGSQWGDSRRRRLSPALCQREAQGQDTGPEQRETVENVTLQWFWMPPSGLVTVNVIPPAHSSGAFVAFGHCRTSCQPVSDPTLAENPKTKAYKGITIFWSAFY